MIDTDKYEGHYTYHESSVELWNTDKAVPNDYDMFWDTNSNQLNADIERANATTNLIADAPLLLAELKRMYEFRDRVLAAFVEMPHNKRSLTYLLNWLGYCNYYSHDDYLKGLHPHSLGLFELKDEWMEKAQQYLESEEE